MPGHKSNQGECYFNGDGIKEDKEEAIKWYRKAAEQGNYIAQSFLGSLYGRGRSVEEEVEWYHRAVEQGLDQAQLATQLRLNDCHYHEESVEKDEENAAEQQCKAAEQCHEIW